MLIQMSENFKITRGVNEVYYVEKKIEDYSERIHT